ncbi:MAG: tetratricopeptide repeat protein [Gemmatimonadota bacterium]
MRITAQLIEAPTDVHLWAETYDRTMDDIFAIQSDVAARIVEALRVQLTPMEKARMEARPTESVEAYQWFLKGRHFLAKRTEKTIRQSIEWFEKATRADPSFAQSWAGLADAYGLLPSHSQMPVEEASSEARSAAQRALALDPGLGEAHAALGITASNEWKWKEAEREYGRAIELNPGYATAHHWYGLLLSNQSRHDEAIEVLSRALEMDPLSLPIHNGLGTAYVNARRYDEAIEIYKKAAELDSTRMHSHLNLAETYDVLGRYEEALREWEAVAAVEPGIVSAAMVASLRSGFATAGPQGYWEAWVNGLASRDEALHRFFHLARASAQLGRVDEAFSWLDELLGDQSSWAVQVSQDPVFDPLRSDPRFDAILHRIGLT